MPNWCFNAVTLHHTDAGKMKALMKRLNSNESIASHFLPVPLEEKDNWYMWSTENWGTKWDFEALDWSRIDNQIEINFESAWSPPIALYNYLVAEGWSVDARYFESGMGYVGRYTDGSDDYYEYDLSDAESIKQIPEDLVAFGNLEEEHEIWKEYNEEHE